MLPRFMKKIRKLKEICNVILLALIKSTGPYNYNIHFTRTHSNTY